MKRYACTKEDLEIRGNDIYCKGCERLFEAEPKNREKYLNSNTITGLDDK